MNIKFYFSEFLTSKLIQSYTLKSNLFLNSKKNDNNNKSIVNYITYCNSISYSVIKLVCSFFIRGNDFKMRMFNRKKRSEIDVSVFNSVLKSNNESILSSKEPNEILFKTYMWKYFISPQKKGSGVEQFRCYIMILGIVFVGILFLFSIIE